jgi:single-strand DNA-binding protein
MRGKNMLNNVSLAGRLTKDPDFRVLQQSGKTVVSFTLAVQRTKEDVDFIPCEAWGKTAESVRDYVSKGSLIGVEGSIKVDSYDTEEGRRTFTKVVANRVHFIILKSAEENNANDEGPSKFMTDEELANQ